VFCEVVGDSVGVVADPPQKALRDKDESRPRNMLSPLVVDGLVAGLIIVPTSAPPIPSCSPRITSVGAPDIAAVNASGATSIIL
jgi:hypothetical protein